jgi:hypothetical protein
MTTVKRELDQLLERRKRFDPSDKALFTLQQWCEKTFPDTDIGHQIYVVRVQLGHQENRVAFQMAAKEESQ